MLHNSELCSWRLQCETANCFKSTVLFACVESNDRPALALSVDKIEFFKTKKRSPELTSFCLADVSKNVACHESANFLPSSVDTARS